MEGLPFEKDDIPAMTAFLPINIEPAKNKSRFYTEKSEQVLSRFRITGTDRIPPDEDTVYRLIESRCDIIIAITKQPLIHIHYLLVGTQCPNIFNLEIILNDVTDTFPDQFTPFLGKLISEIDGAIDRIESKLMHKPEELRMIPHYLSNGLIDILFLYINTYTEFFIVPPDGLLNIFVKNHITYIVYFSDLDT